MRPDQDQPLSIRRDPNGNTTPFPLFLQGFKATLENVFRQREDINLLSTARGLPPYVMRDIMAESPLATFIPDRYGGRGGIPREGVALVEAASYESLALALIFGINWALFIQPVAKYAEESVRAAVLADFVHNRKMGGLMITEPGHGSDALHMQSSWTERDGRCHLQGIKHWAGLTGWADYWLLTARQQIPGKGLGRDIDFFICDANADGQRIVVEEKFHNLGLYMIPYGRNHIDVSIPREQRLLPRSTGIKMMLDLLHRSRLQFPSMAMGFIRRILDEAIEHCRVRKIGGQRLDSYDQVQARLAAIQSAFTVCSAMCLHTSQRAALENDLAGSGLEANAVKACITDLKQEAAQSLLQLVGAKGYRLDHFAGRAIVDSRPFQIFEGSNDILYVQIAETLLKRMKVTRENNLFRFLNGYEMTGLASERLKTLLDIDIGKVLPQRKLLELGQLISRVVAMELVIRLGDRGFDKGLVDSSLAILEQEIAAKLTSYRIDNRVKLVELERNAPSWIDFI